MRTANEKGCRGCVVTKFEELLVACVLNQNNAHEMRGTNKSDRCEGQVGCA